MKPSRLNKVLGLSIGERSLFAAEITSGDRPEVKRVAEFVYPEGILPQEPAAFGAALGAFLREQKFSAKSAVVGLPARWLVVKTKEVPPTDSAMLADLLRLQAEGEFSSELKDLVYDYTADTSAGQPKSVLLVATSKKYINAATATCDAAGLSAVMITPSSVALGMATVRSIDAKNPLVLAVSSAGAELTAQSGGTSSAIRHLRGPGPDRPFVGELRRAISGMPPASSNGSARELVLWNTTADSGFETSKLSENLGITIRNADLPNLGVTTTDATANGDGRKFAAAVALALSGLIEDRETIDFLHSRLAPVVKRTVPLWMILSAVAAVAMIALIIAAYAKTSELQAKVDKINAQIASSADQQKQAEAFVTTVSFAQAWHQGNPRYVMCLRDLTAAIPADGQTYAMSLTLTEKAPPPNQSGSATTVKLPVSTRQLSGRLEGKTSDLQRIQDVLDRLKSNPSIFTEVENAGQQKSGGKLNELSFSITFTYIPPK